MTASLTQSLPPGPVHTNEPFFPLTVDQYHELIRSGKLNEDAPVELLEGILVFKMPKNPPHTTCNGLVRRAVERLLPPNWHYRSQEPITLADGEPEPDGAVVRGRIQDYAGAHPQGRDVALVIEIADSSLERGRGIKLRSYARAGIPQYWIINLLERQIEVFGDPDSLADSPTYRGLQTFPADSQISLVMDGQSIGDLTVSALLA